jgi:hypothetical protein
MNLSRESVLALQRHFLGALSAPARTWLEPMPASPLAFAGRFVRLDRDGCVVDFGSVESPGHERDVVRVHNRTLESVKVRLTDVPPWLTATWRGAADDVVSIAPVGTAFLELAASHDAERDFDGTIRFGAGNGYVDELGVRMRARRAHPIAAFDFNGSPVAAAFDFGTGDQPYVLGIANRASISLVVSISDLPEWMSFEVDGRDRAGPLSGCFFRRTAPFRVALRPRLFGQRFGSLRISTNDPRPAFREMELPFAARFEPAQPCVRAFPAPDVRLRADQKATARAKLENWGRTAARTSLQAASQGLRANECPVIPPSVDGRPGTALVPIEVLPAQLTAGLHALTLSLRVEGGEPASVDVPVQVEVTPVTRRRGSARPEIVAALFTLLLLGFLFVIVVRGM